MDKPRSHSTRHRIDRPLGRPSLFVQRHDKGGAPPPAKPTSDAEFRRLIDATFEVPRAVKEPATIDGADWQAGVSPDNDRYKVLLDGEPLSGAVAASERFGWVDVQVFASHKIDAPAVKVRGTERRKGYVQIVRGDQ